MSLSNNEENQIHEIKIHYIKTSNKEVKAKTFDALSSYGEKGIDAINDLLKLYTNDDDLKRYGLEVIKKTKESMNH
jgi:hypothetical protein